MFCMSYFLILLCFYGGLSSYQWVVILHPEMQCKIVLSNHFKLSIFQCLPQENELISPTIFTSLWSVFCLHWVIMFIILHYEFYIVLAMHCYTCDHIWLLFKKHSITETSNVYQISFKPVINYIIFCLYLISIYYF